MGVTGFKTSKIMSLDGRKLEHCMCTSNFDVHDKDKFNNTEPKILRVLGKKTQL
jgi:hypothetical protein